MAMIVLIYMLLHLEGVELQQRWLISLFSMTSLTSLFAGFTLLFFRFRAVACTFIFVEFFFMCLFCVMTVELIGQRDDFVKYSGLEIELLVNKFVA